MTSTEVFSTTKAIVTRLRKPTVLSPGRMSSRAVPRTGIAETFELIEKGVVKPQGDIGGRRVGDIVVEGVELRLGFRRNDDGAAHFGVVLVACT